MAVVKQVRKTTPIGEAKWAHLNAPNAPFKDANGNIKGDPKYCIDVVFDPKDPLWNAWAKHISDTIKAMPEQTDKKTGEVMRKQSPLKRELDADDNPTGRYYASFKTSDKYKPQVFDKYNKPFDPEKMIGNGSKVRVSYVENEFPAFGGGMNFYLNAVQVLEVVEYKSQNAEAYGFTADASVPEEEAPF